MSDWERNQKECERVEARKSADGTFNAWLDRLAAFTGGTRDAS